MEQFKNITELKAAAKDNVLTAMVNRELMQDMEAVDVGGGKWAFPFTGTIEDKEVEVWVELTLTTKNPTPRKNSKGDMTPAYDPFEARKLYDEEQAIKESEKAAKAAAKEQEKAAKGKK